MSKGITEVQVQQIRKQMKIDSQRKTQLRIALGLFAGYGKIIQNLTASMTLLEQYITTPAPPDKEDE